MLFLEYFQNQFMDTTESDVKLSSMFKPRQNLKLWRFDRTFNNKFDAETIVKSERIWSYRTRSTDSKGNLRVSYRCNLVKFRGQQCTAAIFLLHVYNTSIVMLYRSQLPHNHDEINKKDFK